MGDYCGRSASYSQMIEVSQKSYMSCNNVISREMFEPLCTGNLCVCVCVRARVRVD